MRGVIKLVDGQTGTIHVYACIERIGSVDATCHGFTNGWAVGLLEKRARSVIADALVKWWDSETGGESTC